MAPWKPRDVTGLTDQELSARLVGLKLARRKVCKELGPHAQQATVLGKQLGTLEALIREAEAEVELRKRRRP